jgi:hypothetical protein
MDPEVFYRVHKNPLYLIPWKSLFWEASSRIVGQEIPRLLQNRNVRYRAHKSLYFWYSMQYFVTCCILRWRQSKPKLEDHPLLAARECLFSIFADTFHVWSSCRQLSEYLPWDRINRKYKDFWVSSGFEPSVFKVAGDMAVYS